MQNNLYSRYFYQMLMEYGKVFIPDVGLFSLDYRGAAFQQYMTILHPPSTRVLFDVDAIEPPTFADLLIKFGMESSLALHTQTTLVSDYKAAVQQGIAFELRHFGKIKDGAFTPNDEETFNLYRGLKEISVSPVPASAVGIQHEESFLSDINRHRSAHKSKQKESFLLPWLIILTVLVFIGYWFWKSNAMLPVPPIAVVDQGVVIIDSLPTEDKITDIDISLTDSAITDEVAVTEEPQSPTIEKPVSKPTTSNTQADISSDECVIIVGSFKNHKNASKLQKMISKKGYQAYVSDYNGFRRIGVKFDCKNQDPEAFKLEIRKNINKDAWLLEE